MPKPKKRESKQDFLRRCTAELVDQEGKSSEQAYAVCNAFWDDANSQRAALTLSAPLELTSPEDPEGIPGFLITAYTGQVIDRGWWGKLIIDVAGIKTKSKMPILREHQRDRVVGVGNKAWNEGRNFFIRGDYSNITPDGREVRELGAEGFPWQASIGVWPKKIKVLESEKESVKVNGQTVSGPLEIWQESEVREVSFVALGADDETAAINFAEGARVKVEIERGQPQEHKEGQEMVMTLAQLEKEAPELLKKIQEKARAEVTFEALLVQQPEAAARLRAEGQEAGAGAERSRVVEILEAAGLKGLLFQVIHEGLECKEALKKMLQAHEQVKVETLAAMAAAAPPPVGASPPTVEEFTATDPDPNLPLETRAQQKWDQDPEIRNEFRGFATYLAWLKADESGWVKIMVKK